MEIIAQHGQTLLILGCVFAFFMAWGIGANDVANAMGTSVGSRALTLKQAILIAIVFEFAGAYLAGGEVTSTIRKGILDPTLIQDQPDLLVFGMMASLLAAGTWLLIASMQGWPVSTTHSIVGALVGFAAVGISVDAVDWSKVGSIVASWVVSPVMAGTISFALFISVKKLVLDTDRPFKYAKRYVPVYMFLVGLLIALVTILKGLKNTGFALDFGFESQLLNALPLSIGVGILVALIGRWMLSGLREGLPEHPTNRFTNVEGIFAVLMVFTASAMAFAHGSNDVANAVGPLAAIVSVISSGGEVASKSAMPSWILILGGLGIVIGLATYGVRVMGTIGRKITELTPSRGFAAELGAAATVVLASTWGLPISTTHTLVGAVLGVGLARGVSALNFGVIGRILLSWLITLPAGAGFSILFFFALKGLFV
ncbi:MAG: inorganic phosphate transporter [Gammaproteobacteria bacterium]|nr:inorganic phosphate transporter [Gammaproteobacteria bacterium]